MILKTCRDADLEFNVEKKLTNIPHGPLTPTLLGIIFSRLQHY